MLTFRRYQAELQTLLRFSQQINQEIAGMYYLSTDAAGQSIWERASTLRCGTEKCVKPVSADRTERTERNSSGKNKDLLPFHTHIGLGDTCLPPSPEDIAALLHLHLTNKTAHAMVIAPEGCYFYTTNVLVAWMNKEGQKNNNEFVRVWYKIFREEAYPLLQEVHAGEPMEKYLQFLRKCGITCNLVPFEPALSA